MRTLLWRLFLVLLWIVIVSIVIKGLTVVVPEIAFFRWLGMYVDRFWLAIGNWLTQPVGYRGPLGVEHRLDAVLLIGVLIYIILAPFYRLWPFKARSGGGGGGH